MADTNTLFPKTAQRLPPGLDALSHIRQGITHYASQRIGMEPSRRLAEMLEVQLSPVRETVLTLCRHAESNLETKNVLVRRLTINCRMEDEVAFAECFVFYQAKMNHVEDSPPQTFLDVLLKHPVHLHAVVLPTDKQVMNAGFPPQIMNRLQFVRYVFLPLVFERILPPHWQGFTEMMDYCMKDDLGGEELLVKEWDVAAWLRKRLSMPGAGLLNNICVLLERSTEVKHDHAPPMYLKSKRKGHQRKHSVLLQSSVAKVVSMKQED